MSVCAPAPIAPSSAKDRDELLFDRWRHHGDERSREALVERYLPFARRLARRYAGTSEPLEDLVQVANLGLLKAIERFDVARGRPFASFAVPTILGELRRYFRDCAWAIHLPRGTQERALRVEQVRRELTAHKGRAPTAMEIAERADMELELVLDALQAVHAYRPASLDAPRGGGGGDGELEPLIETLGEAEPAYALVDDVAAISAGLGGLSGRDREILRLRFVEDLTQSDIAGRVGISQMQVSRVLRSSLARLREVADPCSSATGGRGGGASPGT